MSTREELVKAVDAAWDAWAVRAAAGDAASGYDAWDAARQALIAYDKNNTRRG
jgi:hypothetical protein